MEILLAPPVNQPPLAPGFITVHQSYCNFAISKLRNLAFGHSGIILMDTML